MRLSRQKEPQDRNWIETPPNMLFLSISLLCQKEPQDRNWIETLLFFSEHFTPLCCQKEPQDRNWIETFSRMIQRYLQIIIVRKNPRIETGLRHPFGRVKAEELARQKEPQDRNWIETLIESGGSKRYMLLKSERTPG